MKIILDVINKKKGKVINEFKKVCPTERSVELMKKEMHDIFDEIVNEKEILLDKETKVEVYVNKKKGKVLKEFGKICPTNESFETVKKDIHKIFDELVYEIESR